VDVGDDVAEVLLEEVEVFLIRIGILGALLRVQVLLRAGDGRVDLLVRGGDAADDLLALDAYEAVDFIKFLLELLDKALLGLLVPGVVYAQGCLELLVVDIVE